VQNRLPTCSTGPSFTQPGPVTAIRLDRVAGVTSRNPKNFNRERTAGNLCAGVAHREHFAGIGRVFRSMSGSIAGVASWPRSWLPRSSARGALRGVRSSTEPEPFDIAEHSMMAML
jgi:hypothetical protein